ncbi:MAG: hypothetical protein HRT35_13685 [Algicola sp.]|nr:hypothetical protein [Algicola sp.]
MTESLTIDTLFADCRWRLCHLDSEKSTATFNKLSHCELSEHNFADHRFMNHQPGDFVTVPLKALMQLMLQEQNALMLREQEVKSGKPAHYIFHSAFCGSTLLSRALDEPGRCLSIREPYALTQLSAFKRANPAYVAQWAAWPQLLKLTLYFIARGYDENEVTVIKPTNSANNLIPDLLALNTNAQALMLSTSLRQFLVSNLKKGPSFHSFCRTLVSQLNIDTGYCDKHRIQNIDALTPLQQAALVWQMHQQQFKQAKHTLSFDQFMKDKPATLARCNQLFGLGLSSAQLENKLGSDIFKRHAKEQKGDYTQREKLLEDAQITAEYGEVIEQTVDWLLSF